MDEDTGGNKQASSFPKMHDDEALQQNNEDCLTLYSNTTADHMEAAYDKKVHRQPLV